MLSSKGGPRETNPAPVRVDVRTQKARQPQGLRGTTRNPAVSPESAADNIRLRESHLGSPKESSPTRQTTWMCVPLDASPLEKGEINSMLVFVLL